jgi:hypothetical protein
MPSLFTCQTNDQVIVMAMGCPTANHVFGRTLHNLLFPESVPVPAAHQFPPELSLIPWNLVNDINR